MTLPRATAASRHTGLIRLMMLSITGQPTAPIASDAAVQEALLAVRRRTPSDRENAQRRVDQIAGWSA